MPRPPLITVALVACSLGIHAFGLSGAFELDTQGPLGLTFLGGHLAHFSWDHLAWDLLAVGVLGWMLERRSTAAMLATGIIAATLISLCVWIGFAGVTTYRGLSGVATAFFGAVVVLNWRTWPGVVKLAVTIAVGKMVFEAATGRAVFVSTDTSVMRPVPLAHAVGAAVGVGVAAVQRAIDGSNECRRTDGQRVQIKKRPGP